MAARQVKNSMDLRVISDEHPKFVGAFVYFMKKYQDVIGYSAVGMLILISVIVLMNYNNKTKNIEASAALQNALKQYQEDLTASTISLQAESATGEENPELTVSAKSPGSFQSVFDNYPGTASGQNALFMVGVSQLNTGNIQAAIDTFDKFLSEFSDSTLAPSALLGKATALFDLEQTQNSLDLLQQLEQKYPNYMLMDVVIYEKGKRHEAMDQWEEAIKSYQSVIDGYPDSSWKSMCETALKKLEKRKPVGSEEAA